jgi:hypothetical protein
MRTALAISILVVGCGTSDDHGVDVICTTPVGTPRSVQIVGHDVDGTPLTVVAAPDGTAHIDVPPGGAVTAVDDDATYLVSWLAVQPGDQLRDGKEDEAAVAYTSAPGALSNHEISIANVTTDVRYLRARVDGKIDAGVVAGQEIAMQPNTAAIDVPATYVDPAAATLFPAAVIYTNSDAPEAPSSWLYNGSVTDRVAFDAATALPFVTHAAATVAADSTVSVAWRAGAPLAGQVQAGRLELLWHHGASEPFQEWAVRFPYGGDQLVMPRLPGDLAAHAPQPAPDLLIYAELVLVDFVDPADGDKFRRDSAIVGRAIIGANRDLFYLGQFGVRRAALDTPF